MFDSLRKEYFEFSNKCSICWHSTPNLSLIFSFVFLALVQIFFQARKYAFCSLYVQSLLRDAENCHLSHHLAIIVFRTVRDPRNTFLCIDLGPSYSYKAWKFPSLFKYITGP